MNQAQYVLECEAKIHVINITDLIYIEKSQLSTELQLTTGKLDCNKSLKMLMKDLPIYFIKVNRYQIVNLYYIKSLIKQKKEVLLKNGTAIQASHRCFPLIAKALKQVFTSFND